MVAIEPRRVAAVILAAGLSSRFGSPKQLARIGERTLLEAVADVARGADLSPILAVVPPGLPVPPEVVPVVNDEPAAGLSRSLQLGIRAVPPDASAAVILLGDQPTLDPAAVRSLLEARNGRQIVAASAGGLLAPPVLLERAAFDVVEGIAGDAGLGGWLRENAGRIRSVEIAAHAPDVDTPSDLASLEP
jgi:molybdenum cofactor cytidylyltransferase